MGHILRKRTQNVSLLSLVTYIYWINFYHGAILSNFLNVDRRVKIYCLDNDYGPNFRKFPNVMGSCSFALKSIFENDYHRYVPYRTWLNGIVNRAKTYFRWVFIAVKNRIYHCFYGLDRCFMLSFIFLYW